MNRRQFISRSTLATVGALAPQIIPSRLLGASAPSNEITAAFIGTGGHGTGRNLTCMLACPNVRVVAVCDCNLSKTEAAKAKVNEKFGNQDCEVYQDFREVLARPDIDVVVISTPDHWHVPMALMALEAGKDVFCEKPSLTITQGREIVDMAKKKDRVFQWGIEDRNLIKYWMLGGLARTGAVGDVHTVHCTLPLKPLYKYEDPSAIPEGLDWNLWLGPAEFVEYTPNILHPQRWRQRSDYSGGSLTDWGAHLCDTAQVAISRDESGPVEISGTAKDLGPDSYVDVPYGYHVDYIYDNGAKVIVDNGPVNIRIEGSKGWMQCEGWNGNLTAHDREIFRNKDFANDSRFWPRPKIEHQNFIDAVVSRSEPTYHPEAGHRLASMLHLGHIAIRNGKTIYWDPAKETFTKDADELTADKVYQRELRDWENASLNG
ncbi:MAG: Gfo/Idh/MocA family oxidoreductase [Verrucomicrobiota bacterium]